MLFRMSVIVSASLFVASGARADFKDVVAERFSATPEYLIMNLPPRPGAWPGGVFTAKMRVPLVYGKADDPALHKGGVISIDAKDGYDLGAGAKGSGTKWFGLSAEASAAADVVMSFPDAQIVDMSYGDLLEHVEKSPETIAAAKRGEIPLLVIKAYVGTPTITVTKKDKASAAAWAKVTAEVQAQAHAKADSSNSVTYKAGDPIPFAFETSQINFEPTDLSKGKLTITLASLPSSLFAYREGAVTAERSELDTESGTPANNIDELLQRRHELQQRRRVGTTGRRSHHKKM
jgi:hypothetical protein